MANDALGLIETMGLVGVIEAADAALKAASVVCEGFEFARGGLVTVKLRGDVAAVQAAVQAGANSAAKVGQLISAHVIPRPDDQLKTFLGLSEKSETESRNSKEEGDRPQSADQPDELEKMAVTQLRRLARSIEGLSIKGRQISRANKEQLLSEIRKAR